MDDDIKYDYWWAGMQRAYLGQTKMIADAAGSSKRLYYMDKEELAGVKGISMKCAEDIVRKRQNWDLDAEYQKLLESGIDFIPWYSDRFPVRLKQVAGHPFAVFVLGDMPCDNRLSVALIGARNCSEYGRMMAKKLSSDLAGMGVQIVSGMAYGIDGISQTAALDAGGKTFAVLGCGVNICYPASNRGLYERLKAGGGLISEYGIYTQPQSSLFPPRNRIISALADAVVIIEAKEKSGTMITADMALEQGKDVAIVPGRVTDPLSVGCIKLWKQGAVPVTCAEDIVYMLDENYNNCIKEAKRQSVSLSDEERKVFDILEPYAMSVGEISGKTGMQFRRVICVLVELCIKGLAAEAAKGSYVRTVDAADCF